MSAPVARQWVYDALRALQTPREQMWLGAGLATLLVVLFGPGGLTSHTTSPGQGSYQKSGLANVPQATGPHAVYNGNSPPATSLTKPVAPVETLDKSNMPEKPLPLRKEEFASFPSNSPSTPVAIIMDTIPLKPAEPLDMNSLPEKPLPLPK